MPTYRGPAPCAPHSHRPSTNPRSYYRRGRVAETVEAAKAVETEDLRRALAPEKDIAPNLSHDAAGGMHAAVPSRSARAPEANPPTPTDPRSTVRAGPEPGGVFLLGPAYAPWVLDGRHGRHRRAIVVQAEASFSLWRIRSGIATLETEGEARSLPAGSIALLWPRRGLRLHVPAACEHRSVHFHIHHPEQGARGGPRLDPVAIWGAPWPAVAPEAVRASGAAMIDFACNWWWRSPLDHLRANARLADWLAALAKVLAAEGRDGSNAPTEAADPRANESRRFGVGDGLAPKRMADPEVERWLAVARERFWSGMSAEEWARAVGVSPRTLARRIRAALAMPPGAVLRRLRLERATFLLEQSDLPILEVARRSGFALCAPFARFFRQRMGISPSAYRRRHAQVG